MTKYCTACGRAHEDTANFCTACSRPLLPPPPPIRIPNPDPEKEKLIGIALSVYPLVGDEEVQEVFVGGLVPEGASKGGTVMTDRRLIPFAYRGLLSQKVEVLRPVPLNAAPAIPVHKLPPGFWKAQPNSSGSYKMVINNSPFICGPDSVGLRPLLLTYMFLFSSVNYDGSAISEEQAKSGGWKIPRVILNSLSLDPQEKVVRCSLPALIGQSKRRSFFKDSETISGFLVLTNKRLIIVRNAATLSRHYEIKDEGSYILAYSSPLTKLLDLHKKAASSGMAPQPRAEPEWIGINPRSGLFAVMPRLSDPPVEDFWDTLIRERTRALAEVRPSSREGRRTVKVPCAFCKTSYPIGDQACPACGARRE